MAASNRDGAVHILAELLTRFQTAGDFRTDFDPNSMAIAIRAVIDAAPGRLADPAFDIDQYAREAVTIFDRATGPIWQRVLQIGPASVTRGS